MQIDKIKVGQKIKDIRVQNGYSMEKFGEQIGGAPRGSVNSWEKGVNLPSKERLELIAIMGHTTVNELLYGSIEEYVGDLLANNLRIRFTDPFIQFITAQMKLLNYSYGDDVKIIQMVSKFLADNNMYEKKTKVTYVPFSETDNLYIGRVDRDGEFLTDYFVYADTSMNVLHVLPFFMSEHACDYYEYPSTLTEAGEHDYFSTDFSSVQIELETAVLIYYGIDIVRKEENICLFKFNSERDCFVLEEEEPDMQEMNEEFFKELQKEVLYINI